MTSLAKGAELRGLWVDAFGPGFLSREEVQQLGSDCRKYHFNAVFVQMRKRGDAYYFPKLPNCDPRADEIAGDFDALDEIIKECHGKEPRIQVHCWLVSYFVWARDKAPTQKEHIFNRHPDYLTRDSTGQKFLGKGYYLDPGHPGVGTELLNAARDVASRYEIDGLHWDYLRYPEQDAGYNETAIRRYKQEFSVTNDPTPADPRFCEWRRRQVTDFLRWSTAELLEIRPQIVISAAVFANHKDSRDFRFADWADWNRERIVDAIAPMDFTADNRFIFEPRAQFALTNQWNRTVWLGQAGYMNWKEATVKQLEFCRNKEFGGTMFYCYRKPARGVALLSGEEDESTNVATPEDLVIDNEQAQIVGTWQSGKYGKFYGKDYLFHSEGAGENCVRFIPTLPREGDYEVYEWHVAGPNRASDARFMVVHDWTTNAVVVDEQRAGSRWNRLGKYHFETNAPAEVRVTDAIQGRGKVVVADAVRFAPVSSVLNKETSSQSKTNANRAAQESILAFIRDAYQPAWVPAPALPWKLKPSSGIIKGTITNQAGEPIYNACVELVGGSQQKQKTEPHGKYAFFEIPPGDYTVKVICKNHGSTEQKTRVEAGRMTTLDVCYASAKP